MSASFCSMVCLKQNESQKLSASREKRERHRKIQMVTISVPLGTNFSGNVSLRPHRRRRIKHWEKGTEAPGKNPSFSVVETKSVFGAYMEYTGVWGILEYMESIFDQDNLASCVMLILKSGVSVLSKSSLPTRPLL